MNKIVKTIGIIATMGILFVCSCLLDAIQAEIIAEIQTDTTICKPIPDGMLLNGCMSCTDHHIDMNEVVDFSVTEYGLQLYFADGSGYYLER